MGRLLIVLFTFTLFFRADATVERRATIDVGSGGTKIAIADVETDTNTIVEVVMESSFPVPYQNSLDKSDDGTFDDETKNLGLHTFQKIKEITNQHQVEKIVAVATSAFRKSNNAVEFTKEVEAQTGIEVKIISQKEEGEIAFFSAMATGNYDPAETVVWDIGTGSMQITTMNEKGNLVVYMGEAMGSIAFKNHIISSIQEQDLAEVDTPNPLRIEDVKKADRYVRGFGRSAYPLIKKKIVSQKKVVGIGRLFYNSIRPVAAKEDIISRSGLRKYISNSLYKTDEEINNPYANVDVSNCILALGIMKSLHIRTIEAIETTSTKGLLVAPAYWNNQQ